MLRQLELSESAFAELMRHAQERGLIFMASPFDVRSAQALHELGMPLFKVASGELTNLPLLAQIASLGRPMVVSTRPSSGKIARTVVPPKAPPVW